MLFDAAVDMTRRCRRYGMIDEYGDVRSVNVADLSRVIAAGFLGFRLRGVPDQVAQSGNSSADVTR